MPGTTPNKEGEVATAQSPSESYHNLAKDLHEPFNVSFIELSSEILINDQLWAKKKVKSWFTDRVSNGDGPMNFESNASAYLSR